MTPSRTPFSNLNHCGEDVGLGPDGIFVFGRTAGLSANQVRTFASANVLAATFTNPIAPGADPWVVQHGGFYYWCASENDLAVVVYRSSRLSERGEKMIVWRAPPERSL